MNFLPLLAKNLKDDDVVDVLESYDMEVVYDFDRTHENLPDVYWSAAANHGFRFRFDAAQVLDTIFLHCVPTDRFSPINKSACDICFHSSILEIELSAARQKLRVTKGTAEFLGVARDWARIEHENH